ncbi:LysR family transcriptional regulator [Plesiomonas sp.]|uniref:LysR family transcriptional regulator n=1 Tax=Plesiomonas sp. TaxID=2486279 RepID=UPI003F35483D
MRVKIEDMILFNKLADTLNFSVAAEALRIPISTLSRRIAAFEKELNIPILIRSTRQVKLTPEGENILLYCREILSKKNELEEYVTGNYHNESGDLVVVASNSTISFLTRHFILAFSDKYPNIHVILKDIGMLAYDEQRDITLTTQYPKDPSLVVTRVTTIKKYFFASPSYIAQHGEPLVTEDLAFHHVLRVKNEFDTEISDYYGQLGISHVGNKNEVTYSDMLHALDMAVNGLGIVWAPLAMIQRRTQPGQLKMLFGENSAVNVLGYAVYKKRFIQPSKIVCFVSELKNLAIALAKTKNGPNE